MSVSMSVSIFMRVYVCDRDRVRVLIVCDRVRVHVPHAHGQATWTST
jgi:hypothetical protein